MFRITDFRRAVRAARAEGLPVAGVKIGRGGEIEIVVGKPAEAAPAGGANEWDKIEAAE
jgi:hypothetical protein